MVWTKWSYMDHWVTETPQGPQPPSFNRAYMDRYIKQLSALGFTGFDTFFFYLPFYAGMYGGVPGFERFLQDNGFDKITGIFSAYPSATKYTAPHVRETHDRIVADCTNTLRMCEGLTGVENFIVMPTSTYHQTEPVTDDTIKVVADLWNRVGKLTLEQGMKTTCHFEFWGAIRTREQLDTFFRYTDPEYVYFFCDTAQHTIAGVDPVQMFRDYSDRCTGFHFKDTKNVDEHEAYRTPPDPELMAPEVTRWFYEMGEGGLVDFPALMKEIVASGYDGWLTVEHDKAELGGGSYAEATAVAKWYIDNVLARGRGRGPRRAGERAMRDTLRWAYALNQWNVRLDVFVRHEDQQRALKTVSACGFDTIELASGTGRWDNISRPEVILLNHGSHEGFLDFLRRAKVQGVSSMFWDPQAPTEEEEGYAFRSTANPADSDAIVEWSKPFVDFVAGVGADQLVVRPVGSAWMTPAAGRRRDQGHRRRLEPDRRAGRPPPGSASPCTTTAWAPCTRKPS